MEYSVEPGEASDEVKIVLKISPEEREILKRDVAYFTDMCKNTNDQKTQPRLLLFNAGNRHLRLLELLKILGPLLTDPETLK